MCLQRHFAIRAQNIYWIGDLLVNILDEFLDWLAKYGTFVCGQRLEIRLRESSDLGGAFRLLALTADVQLIMLGVD